ncbi:MAG: O-acetyl-ADP-ribose deacetylase [Bacteroidetes bacterium]|nr:MAG: O-acetyl-ADP-ribose deacetylase [Bacteroidota bacterium]
MQKNRIEVIQGDITKLKVDAIINAANSSLMGGGGVDGAIHRAAGPKLVEECKKIIREIGSCPAGEAVITSGCDLVAKYVIHTVGPVYRSGKNKEPELLANAYKNSLRIAVENNLKSIAFPNISTGIYGYPKEDAAGIAIATVKDFLKHNDLPEKVIFVCFDYENYNIYNDIFNRI